MPSCNDHLYYNRWAKSEKSLFLVILGVFWCVLHEINASLCEIVFDIANPVKRLIMRQIQAIVLCATVLITSGCLESEQENAQPPLQWYKGNLHTHTLWSDGDDYPEMVISWYKGRGYNFLALSDHNVLAEGDRWVPVEHTRGGRPAFELYQQVMQDQVASKMENDTLWARLQNFDESAEMFNEAGSFLMIRSEEITDGFEGKPVHVNATNIQEYIPPQGGASVRDVMQQNVDAVLAQRSSIGTPMFPHINHPNFGWAITAEDLIALEGEQFFEVYNGHPMVRNLGEGQRPGMESMWDIVLTRRLLNQQPIMYGIAVDDSHNYHDVGLTHSNPGRAWVMVRASALTADALIAAMEAGDFYGSTGVVIDDVQVGSGSMGLMIAAEEGVTYRTEFIGTRAQHDTTSVAVVVEDENVTRRYSEEVGEVFAIVEGPAPVFTFEGDELYVRAKVISSKPKENPYHEGETEAAWTQPVVVGHKSVDIGH